MPRKQELPKPFWSTKHEFDASFKAYNEAATMLHQAVKSAIELGTTPDTALRCMKILKERESAFAKAAYGDE